MPSRPAIVLALIVALPPVAATSWALAVAAGERAGRAPFAAPAFRNSAEAAAAGDPATMLRLLRLGDNPSWVHEVRPEFISASYVRVSTLEAAMWSRHVEMIRALDRAGAIVGDDQRRELACLARDLDMPEAADYLAPAADCEPGRAVKRVAARSASPERGSNEN